MRKIIAAEFVSLDGVTESPEKWTFDYYTDEIGAHIGSSFATSDTMLLGRVTYEGFKTSFSGQTGGVADSMNSQPKYVVSTTMKLADWNNTTLLNKNIVEEISKLKRQPGKDIVITGSITLVQSLTAKDLIDEYSLLVYPVALGTGKRLFPEGIAKSALKLIESRSFNSGVVLLRYQPAKSA